MLDTYNEALGYQGDVTSSFASEIETIRTKKRNLIRDLVLNQRRIDVLASHVLYPGMDRKWFHDKLMEHQDLYQEAMVLAWRGCGKSTYCTITRVIFEILHNPNIRILLVSDSEGQSTGFLRAIKSHFEANTEFRELFGDYVGETWSNSEIIIPQRTSHFIEPTVLCAGIGTSLPSKHFDLIIMDDLVTLDNSRTPGLRKKTLDYYYNVLYPTLESPTGRLYVNGTRWHEEDLYGHFEENDFKNATLRIGVLEESEDGNPDNDRSVWEEKFPTEKLLKIRRGQFEAFELQYMCRANAGGAGILVAVHFELIDRLPSNLRLWQGVDLAIGRKKRNDHFAHCTLGIEPQSKEVCLVSYNLRKLSFPAQVKYIKERFDDYPDAIKIGVENNAYQDSLRQQVIEQYPHVPVVGRNTQKDKESRAQQIAAILTNRPLKVLRIHHAFVRLLCGFPNKKGSKDLFDAFEIAYAMSLRGVKKKRKVEPGLL